MNTLLLKDDEYGLKYSAGLIKNGEIVAFPTETVYGLGADATNDSAVRKIFEAKGRPSDNPLIVHLHDFNEAVRYTKYIPEIAFRVAEKFCPGAITLVLPKNDKIPSVTSGGLDTVGIRIPLHPSARKLIELSGKPVAAPSANTSGYPSPTSAMHVMRDMNGKIPAIIDGGESLYGVESTVISFENENTVRILRPGFITREDLLSVCDNVIIDPAVLEGVKDNQKVASPGMKYKHYSPSADIALVEGDINKFALFAKNHKGEGIYYLVFDEDSDKLNPDNCIPYGADSIEQAHLIFAKLRELDDIGAKRVYVRVPEKTGVGLAVYNRLIRSAGFEVIRL